MKGEEEGEVEGIFFALWNKRRVAAAAEEGALFHALSAAAVNSFFDARCPPFSGEGEMQGAPSLPHFPFPFASL